MHMLIVCMYQLVSAYHWADARMTQHCMSTVIYQVRANEAGAMAQSQVS